MTLLAEMDRARYSTIARSPHGSGCNSAAVQRSHRVGIRQRRRSALVLRFQDVDGRVEITCGRADGGHDALVPRSLEMVQP